MAPAPRHKRKQPEAAASAAVEEEPEDGGVTSDHNEIEVSIELETGQPNHRVGVGAKERPGRWEKRAMAMAH